MDMTGMKRFPQKAWLEGKKGGGKARSVVYATVMACTSYACLYGYMYAVDASIIITAHSLFVR